MKRLLLLAPLLLFGVAGSYMLFVFLRAANEGAFQSSLLPELIGFCLEGFFLVGLFSVIQRRQERDRKEELRNSLRGALREILSHLDLAMLGEHASPAPSLALERDPRIVATLILNLNSIELDVESMRNINCDIVKTMHSVADMFAKITKHFT